MYDQYIYETPDTWGSLTVYANQTGMQETIAGLIAAGGEDWANISLGDCAEWSFVEIPDLSQPNVFLYSQWGRRTPQWARFTRDGDYYTAVEFFNSLDAAREG